MKCKRNWILSCILRSLMKLGSWGKWLYENPQCCSWRSNLLSSKMALCWGCLQMAIMHVARGLELDDCWDPFQPKPFYYSVVRWYLTTYIPFRSTRFHLSLFWHNCFLLVSASSSLLIQLAEAVRFSAFFFQFHSVWENAGFVTWSV